jgi:hypothetical protein
MNHLFEHINGPMAALWGIHWVLCSYGWLPIEVPGEIDALLLTPTTVIGRPTQPHQVPSLHIHHSDSHSLRNAVTYAKFALSHPSNPYRNAKLWGRFPPGRLIPKSVFRMERQLLRGPTIIAYSKKP